MKGGKDTFFSKMMMGMSHGYLRSDPLVVRIVGNILHAIVLLLAIAIRIAIFGGIVFLIMYFIFKGTSSSNVPNIPPPIEKVDPLKQF